MDNRKLIPLIVALLVLSLYSAFGADQMILKSRFDPGAFRKTGGTITGDVIFDRDITVNGTSWLQSLGVTGYLGVIGSSTITGAMLIQGLSTLAGASMTSYIYTNGWTIFTKGSSSMVNSTTDGADDGSFGIGGGGACTVGRGAATIWYGNEYGGNQDIAAGEAGQVKFFTGATRILRGNFDATGSLELLYQLLGTDASFSGVATCANLDVLGTSTFGAALYVPSSAGIFRNGGGGGFRCNTVSSDMFYNGEPFFTTTANGVDASGTVVSDMDHVLVCQAAAQTLDTGVSVAASFTTETLDPNGSWNVNEYTAPSNGYYVFSPMLTMDPLAGAVGTIMELTDETLTGFTPRRYHEVQVSNGAAIVIGNTFTTTLKLAKGAKVRLRIYQSAAATWATSPTLTLMSIDQIAGY